MRMSFWVWITMVVAALVSSCFAGTAYVVTNNDNPSGNSATIYSLNTSTGALSPVLADLPTGGFGNGGGYFAGTERALHDDCAAPEWRLRERNVHHRRGILTQRNITNIPDDADDFAVDTGVGRKREGHVLSNWIFVWKIYLRHRLANYSYARRVHGIVLIEVAARQ